MIKLINEKTYLKKGREILETGQTSSLDFDLYKKNTMSYKILQNHNTSGNSDSLAIKFDSLASHDITYVGIVQTAKASGLEEFPIPYVLTNCHNSLCAVGGTINEDDHMFGLSAAKKYGGIYVPAHFAVIHQYMREMMSGCGKMILGSDSHTRYGALGTMAIGEGGPELVKQLLQKTYDLKYPEICLVYLEGQVKHGVGPQDVALAIIGAVFKKGFVKNKVLEFAGPGIANLSVDFRNGIDVMTTETTCLSSIWETDDKVKEYFSIHKREEEYSRLQPGDIAAYDCMVKVNLSAIENMIAMPFHPSNTYTVKDLISNAKDIFHDIEKNAREIMGDQIEIDLISKIRGKDIYVDQGIIAGCAGGTFENILTAAAMIEGKNVGHDDFTFSVYPQSQPVNYALNKAGAMNTLMTAGAVIKTAFCGPCFGAGDVPSNNAFSIRHTTRNFPNREGSKPGEGQIASVALMDARSIAATAVNKGILTPATEMDYKEPEYIYEYNEDIYKNRVYDGFSHAIKCSQLKLGPNIKEWPVMDSMYDHLLLQVVSVIDDPVTTTDELIPSGETSSYRSNPIGLAEFTLSRKDPSYVGRAKQTKQLFEDMKKGKVTQISGIDLRNTGIGSVIYANKPGDGSAREQAASCQKVLGGWANIATEYATKRYRSNLVNWGMLPFTVDQKPLIEIDDFIFIPDLKKMLLGNDEEITGYVVNHHNKKDKVILRLAKMTRDERDIILSGCLMNYYRDRK
ncbi:MAG: hydratase [Clostridia bacterium]|nr:hydratase [Clostridia bacterium]